MPPRTSTDSQSFNYVESEHARADLTEWLRKHANSLLTSSETEEGFDLRCFAESPSGQRDIGTYTWNVIEAIDKVAEEIMEDCEEDCLRFRGKVRYSTIILSSGLRKRCNFILRTPTSMNAEFDFDDFAQDFARDEEEDDTSSLLPLAAGNRGELRELISELKTEVTTLRRLCGELMKRLGN